MCQLAKKQEKKYGKFLAKKAEEVIWSRVNVDVWGPATINNKKNWKMNMHLMMMMDPATCWFEVVPIREDPSSYECNRIFDEVWFSRYPRP